MAPGLKFSTNMSALLIRRMAISLPRSDLRSMQTLRLLRLYMEK